MPNTLSNVTAENRKRWSNQSQLNQAWSTPSKFANIRQQKEAEELKRQENARKAKNAANAKLAAEKAQRAANRSKPFVIGAAVGKNIGHGLPSVNPMNRLKALAMKPAGLTNSGRSSPFSPALSVSNSASDPGSPGTRRRKNRKSRRKNRRTNRKTRRN